MTEKIKYEWELPTLILSNLNSSFPLLAADSPIFGSEQNPKIFILRLYYQSLSLELGDFPTPVKIKSFAAKIYGDYRKLDSSREDDNEDFSGSVRQIFPGSF